MILDKFPSLHFAASRNHDMPVLLPDDALPRQPADDAAEGLGRDAEERGDLVRLERKVQLPRGVAAPDGRTAGSDQMHQPRLRILEPHHEEARDERLDFEALETRDLEQPRGIA